MKLHAGLVKVLHVLENAPSALTKLHDVAHVFAWGEHRSLYHRLLCGGDNRRFGIVCGVVDINRFSAGEVYLIDYRGGGGYKVKVVFTLQTFLNYLHMEQTQKAAAESEAQSNGSLRLKGQGCVVEAKLVQSVPQIAVAGSVGRVNAAEHHWIYFAIAGKRLSAGTVRVGNGVANLCVAYGFYGRGDIAYLACAESSRIHKLSSAHVTRFNYGKLRSGRHKTYGLTYLYFTVNNADVDNYALVAVVKTVEYQGLERTFAVPLRAGYISNYPFQYFLNVSAHFCGNSGSVHSRYAYNVLHFIADTFGVCGGQVYLVYHGHYFKIVFNGEISIGKSLSFDTLGRVHNKYGSLARYKGTGHLIVEVNVTGGVNKIENVGLTVLCGIVKTYRTGFYGNAPLPLDVHIVKELLLHVTLCNGGGKL